MAANAYGIHANTAASLLHYTEYDKQLGGGVTAKCWTRHASANEEFNIVMAGNLRFLIKFDKNFSKKHLVTFSKKESKTATEAWLQSQQPGRAGQDAENWNRAQIQLLNNKILRTLGIRDGTLAASLCKHCGHPKKNVPAGTGHHTNGLCRVAGCHCPGFVSNYVDERMTEGKPLHNPYEGAPATTSSCLVLNWIPKNEFEQVVGHSILQVDPTNTLPNSLVANNAPLVHLVWDFPLRPGAVRAATLGAITVADGTQCTIGARKAIGGPPGIAATWTIVHWG